MTHLPAPALHIYNPLNPNAWTRAQWQAHYRLSSRLADVFWVLLRHSPDGYISWQDLADTIYTPPTRNRMAWGGRTSITRSIQRLRAKITKGLYTIETLNTVGYRLVRKGTHP